MIDKTISHYKIIEKLGDGGMGEVYLAEDTKLKRKIALKFLPKEFSRNPESKKRFMKEARAASSLDHANICVIHDINETEEGQMFISMNYCKGMPLQNYILEKEVSLKEVLKYITQIAKGLEKAHSHEIIHCDIKSSNIIITEDGVAKIIDFGIAKIAGEEKLVSKERTSGTIAYMSPEQVSNSNIDNRTDIWSLGVIFYEMLTKQVPFQDSYNEALMYSIINEQQQSITKLNPDIPIEIEQIVNKMLSKNPDNRYQQIGDLLTDLKNYKRQQDLPPILFKTLNNLLNSKYKNWIYRISAILLISLISLVGYFTIIRAQPVPSIGIMNMENLGNPEDEFWSRGITEDLIINVASAGIIRVPTINEMNKYTGLDFSVKKIAEKLRVDYLLSSSLFKKDSTFDLWCRIIDPKTGKDIFARKWSKPIHEASSITTILAGTVLNNLGVSSDKTSQIPVIVDPDAYEYYLRGKNIWDKKKNNNDIELARGLLKKAIDIDPNFILAKMQLGQTFMGPANYSEAKILFSESLTYANQIGDEKSAALAMFHLGNVSLHNYNTDEAIKYYNDALKIVRKYGDKYTEIRILRNIGGRYYWEGKFSQAEQYFSESRVLSAILGDIQGEGEALNNLGSIYLTKRDYLAAMESFIESYDIFKKIENKSQMVNSLIGLSYSSMGLGKIESALNYANASLQAAKEISDKRNEINSLSLIGEINYKIGNHDSALNIFIYVSKLAENIDETYYSGIAYQYLGQVMSQKELYEESFKYFELAANVWSQLDDPTHGIWTASAWALASLKFGDNMTATKKYLESEKILDNTKPYEDYAVCAYYDLYNYNMAFQDTSMAMNYLSSANDEINDRLKFINNSKDRYTYVNRIIKYKEIVDLYEQYFD